MNKKVLLITPTIPAPNGWGVQRRAFNHLCSLSDDFQLDVLVVSHLKHHNDTLPAQIGERCHGVYDLRIPMSPPTSDFKLPGQGLVHELFNPSYKRNMPNGKQLQDIARIINGGRYDTIFCFRIRTSIILDHLESSGLIQASYKKIVDFDDIESIALRREYDNKKHEIGLEYGLIQKLRIKRLKALEKQLLKNYIHVIVCSEDDKKRVQSISDASSVAVVPNCVEMPTESVELMETLENLDNNVIKILFVGTMSYLPNVDGVKWFVQNIYDAIVQQSDHKVELFLVGFNPPEDIKAFNNMPGITVTGGVDSVEPYYQNADLVVAPIRFGGGTRIKILEALSFGKAVISTPIGAEGINIKDRENILLAGSESQFLEACLKLIKSPEERQQLGRKGKELIRTMYTLDAFKANINKLI